MVMFATARPHRRHPRCKIATSAVVCHRSRYLPALVENLSAGGALLRGEETPELDEVVEVVLRLPDRPALNLTARVVRCEGSASEGGQRYAVTFKHEAPRTEAALALAVETLLRGHRRALAPEVLLLDPLPDRAVALARAVEALGRQTVLVGTALEALAKIEDPDHVVDTIVIEWAAAEDGLALLELLATEYPTSRRVALVSADELLDSRMAARARQLAHAVLARPFSTAELAHAIAR
jgi:CheY-like chemotaxis protein